MEDIISKYKRGKRIKNIVIVTASLALALGLNFIFLDTNIGKYLKTNVIGSQVSSEKKPDLYLENLKNSGNIIINLKSSKEMQKVKSISFSLVYNDKNVSLKDKRLGYDNAELLNLIDNNGYNIVIINFKNPTNIKAEETLLSIVLEKKDPIEENLNLINSNFTDADNNLFMLTTSGVRF